MFWYLVLAIFASSHAHAEHASENQSQNQRAKAPDIGQLLGKLTGQLNDHEGDFLAGGGVATLGGGQIVERVRFGKNEHLFCGVAGYWGFDISASVAAGHTFASPGCTDAAKYAGPMISVNLAVATPVAKVGAGASLGLGLDSDKIDEHLPKLISGVRAFVKASGTKGLARALRDAITPVAVKRTGLDKFADAATLIVGRLIAAFDRAGGEKLPDLTDDLLKELPDAAGELAKLLESEPKIDWSGILKEALPSLEKSQPALAKALGHLVAMLSGCDTLGVGAAVGIGLLPGAATLSFSYSSDLGAGPLAGLKLAGGPPAQMLHCMLPALEQACRIGGALTKAGLLPIFGVSPQACEEAKRFREMVQKLTDPLAVASDIGRQTGDAIREIREDNIRRREMMERAKHYWNDADGKHFAEREACNQLGFSFSTSERGRARFCNAKRTAFGLDAVKFCTEKCGYWNLDDPGCARGCGKAMHDFCVGTFSCKD